MKKIHMNERTLEAQEFLQNQGEVNDTMGILKLNIISQCLVLQEMIWKRDAELELEVTWLHGRILELEEFVGADINTEVPEHYKGKQDVIEFFSYNTTVEEFTATMIFNIIKYTTRLGRKDDEKKEVQKIRTYFRRLEDELIERGVIY